MNNFKRQVVLLSLLISCSNAIAQNVGLGTVLPEGSAKLDITATDKGLLYPRVALPTLTGNNITTYGLAGGTPTDGMTVFNTTISTSFGIGLYVWHNAAWNRITTALNPGNDKNIYEGSGTLTNNRTVEMAANNLTFSNPGTFQITTTVGGEHLQYLATGGIPAGMLISNDNGVGRVGVAGSPGDYGATNGGDFMINNNTANRGVGISTTGFSGAALYVASNGNVGVNTSTPAPSAALEIDAPNKAVLLPRVPTTASITTPVDGMIIYDISAKCIKAYENGAWTPCLSAQTPAGPQVEVNCTTTALNGSYTKGTPLTAANTFTVNLANNSFTAASVSTSTADLALSGAGAAGMSVTAVSPTPTLSLASGGGTGTITYTISGTPTASGTFTATWTKLSLTCAKSAATCNVPTVTISGAKDNNISAVDYLVVAGGGGGGTNAGAGGGGGGVKTATGLAVTPGTSYPVVVGAGGANGSPASNGGNSSFNGILSTGGGHGGFGDGTNNGPNSFGGNGGSGGGSGSDASGGTIGTGISGQGFNGGLANGSTAQNRGAGGGGGATAVGGNAVVNSKGGNGGQGLSSSITATAVVYGSGGGGGAHNGNTISLGGTNAGNGGAGNGTAATTGATSPVANTGAGGGGGSGFGQLGTTGATGIVVLSYTGVQAATGGTVSSAGGKTIHKFTVGGTLNIPSSYCAGVSSTFTATTVAPSPSYQWKLNNVNIGGATSASYTTIPTVGQVYSVAITFTDACAGVVTVTSNTITVNSCP